MPIELSPQTRADAIASMKHYFAENLEPIGDLPAGLLLNYMLEELGRLFTTAPFMTPRPDSRHGLPISKVSSTSTSSSTGLARRNASRSDKL